MTVIIKKSESTQLSVNDCNKYIVGRCVHEGMTNDQGQTTCRFRSTRYLLFPIYLHYLKTNEPTQTITISVFKVTTLLNSTVNCLMTREIYIKK